MGLMRFGEGWRAAALTMAVASLGVAQAELPESPGAAVAAQQAAQQQEQARLEGVSSSRDASANDVFLPDTAEAAMGFGGAAAPAMAGRYQKVILPGQQAPRLSASDKFVLGVKDAVSPFSAAGWVIVAGYEQAVDGSPNYGQTGKGFAQRLGAAAARDTSQGIFGDSILSPILHEDPRYYKMGRGHSFIKRLFYSGSRPIFTRTDGGRQTINLALMGGNLSGSALTQLYYPPLNRSFDEVMKTFGSSMGGSALGFVVSEFLSDALHAVHLSKSE